MLRFLSHEAFSSITDYSHTHAAILCVTLTFSQTGEVKRTLRVERTELIQKEQFLSMEKPNKNP